MKATEYKFNLQRSEIDPQDYKLESIYPIKVELPEVYDLRKELMPIRDQGMQGSCSAQSAALMKEWQEKQDVNFKEYMSPQFVYNLRENQDSEGMTPKDTMKILQKIGIVPENMYRYYSKKKIDQNLIKTANNFKIIGYAQVGTIDSLKKAIFANGPCYIAFPVYNPENPEFWKQGFKNQPMQGGHAVNVVGWLKNAFIIRNSWGNSWGYDGYTFYPFSSWGLHWECWTTIDDDSTPDGLVKKLEKFNGETKKGFFARLFAKKIKNKE